MAKARGASAGGAAGKARGSGTRSLGVIAVAAGVAVVGVVSPVAAVVAMCGLLPTFAAVLADWGENKAMAVTIGGMNVAGVFPFLAIVWITGGIGSRSNVVEIVFPMTIMYGAAGLGWVLATFIPRLVYAMYNAERDRKITALRELQEELVAKWGNAVAASPQANPAPSNPLGSRSQAGDVIRQSPKAPASGLG